MSSNEFLHVASGPSAGEVVEATLRRLGRDEPVIAMPDPLNLGPLTDVDSGAKLRVAWWRSVHPEEPEHWLGELDEARLWQRVRESSSSVVVWHGPHPMEWLLSLRLCWYLRDQPWRVFEVALPPPPPSRRLAPFFGAVPLVGPVAAAAHWPSLAKVTDVAERAARWVALRETPGEWVRVLAGREIIQLPNTTFDAELEAAAASGWTASARAIGTVLVEHPIADAFLAWRGRELLRQGRWEGRGEPGGWLQLPTEVRTTSGRAV